MANERPKNLMVLRAHMGASWRISVFGGFSDIRMKDIARYQHTLLFYERVDTNIFCSVKMWRLHIFVG